MWRVDWHPINPRFTYLLIHLVNIIKFLVVYRKNNFCFDTHILFWNDVVREFTYSAAVAQSTHERIKLTRCHVHSEEFQLWLKFTYSSHIIRNQTGSHFHVVSFHVVKLWVYAVIRPIDCQSIYRTIYSVSQKNYANLFFLSELCQISTDCEKFWHKDSKEDKLFWGIPIFHLT